jgi:hypothetical protein
VLIESIAAGTPFIAMRAIKSSVGVRQCGIWVDDTDISGELNALESMSIPLGLWRSRIKNERQCYGAMIGGAIYQYDRLRPLARVRRRVRDAFVYALWSVRKKM